jgi:hypothetical protein
MKYFLMGLGILIFLIILGFGLDLLGLHWYKFIQPKKEAARREVFLNTRSYNEGMIQNLIKYKHEYDLGNDDEKKIITNTIRHMYAEFDESKLNPELRDFLKKIKYGE